MNVISCFDGISCGQLALKRTGIKYDKYYSSEIHKNSIAITQKNFPNTVQLGDITNWRNWDIDFSKIDLLIGGSPCFLGNTPILTNKGYKDISAIKIHEKVLTHKNVFQKVLKTGGKLANIFEIEINDVLKISTTANHPFYVKESKESEPIWKKVEDLKETDFLIMHNFNSMLSHKNLSAKDIDLYKKYKDWLYNIKKHCGYYIDENFIYFHFKKIQNTYTSEMVYNLEVEKDNSYVAHNCIVHNCQGFSFLGKQLNFDDPRSKLFYEFYEILKHIQKVNPNVKFLLENVKMKKEYIDVFNNLLKVKPIEINSAIVSAQRRKRLYWTNIENVEQPTEKQIFLSDIININLPVEITFEEMDKRLPRQSWYYAGKKIKEFYNEYNYYPNYFNPYNKQDLKDKSLTLTTHCGQVTSTAGIVIITKDGVRSISINELEQLQTLPVNYTDCNNLSKHARAMPIGNGWTVDVISHIFQYLK